MMVLQRKDLYIDCACGTKFVATEKDFKMDMRFGNRVFTLCPTCAETYYVIWTEFDVAKPEIKGEKIEDENITAV